MTSPQELDRHVRRSRSDLTELYMTVSRISTVQGLHAGRLDEIQGTLDLHSRSLDRLEETQRKQTELLRGHGKRLDELLGLLRNAR
jgi:hypothetical protein